MDDKSKVESVKPAKKRGARIKPLTDVAAGAAPEGSAAAPASTAAVAAATADSMAAIEAVTMLEAVASPPAAPTPVNATSETTLHLESTLEIKDVETTHRRLVDMLERGPAVTVDISHVGAMDTAGAQLLLAFQSEALKRGLSVEFSGRSTAFTHALTILGLSDAVRHVVSHD
jgi:anti-anti-sigma regulatory factor